VTVQVGFHLFEYARHFLTCCKRQMGLDLKEREMGSGPGARGDIFLTVRDNERNVVVVISHAGIEPSALEQIEATSLRADPRNEAFAAAAAAHGADGADGAPSPLSLSPGRKASFATATTGICTEPRLGTATPPPISPNVSSGGGGFPAALSSAAAAPPHLLPAHLAPALVRSPLLSALPSPIARNVSDAAHAGD